jgi:hypothetical protein
MRCRPSLRLRAQCPSAKTCGTQQFPYDPYDVHKAAFIAKLSADGTTLLYATYLGGFRTDEAHGIAVDSSGNAYVTGAAASPDFPTTAFPEPSGGGLLISSLWIPTLLVTLSVLTILLKCRRRACLALALVMTVAGLWVGCAGGGSRSGSSGGNTGGLQRARYSLTVTGTTGSGGSALQHSLQFILKVS